MDVKTLTLFIIVIVGVMWFLCVDMSKDESKDESKLRYTPQIPTPTTPSSVIKPVIVDVPQLQTTLTSTQRPMKDSMGIFIAPQYDAPAASKKVTKQTIRNLNRMYGNGKLPPKSDYAQLAATGKVFWNPSVGSWQSRQSSVNSAPTSSSVTEQTIRNLNRMYGNGKLPVKSDYAPLVTSGRVYWNPNANSWQATGGSAVGYKGVGNPTKTDIQNLNRMYGSGKVPDGSRLQLLADSGKVRFVNGRWVDISTGNNNAPTSSSVTEQTIRNLNRMYGNGKLPVKSDYAPLVTSGKVYWNPNANSWQATGGSAVGYTGVGNPSSMDLQNLNRMYGDGNVSDGSRFQLLADSGKVRFVNGRWISTV
jgi:hypothetical protein